MADDAQNGDGLIPLELTAAQRGMWFAENLSQGYSVNIAQFLDIRDVDKPLDTSLFVRVAAETGHDLELAFTRIVDVDGIPRQIVDQSIENSVRLLDLRHESDPEFAARQWMNADYQSETNLLEDRLVESALIRVADDRHLWYLRAHHIALDGYAALTAVREVLERYNAALRGLEHRSPVGASLAEIVADDQKYQMSSRRESDRAHWAETVQDLPERVTLARRAATAALVPQNLVAGRQLTAEEQDVLDQTARATSSSAAVLLTAAFSAYLARAATTDDVVLSLPVTGRATAKIKRGSGMLANMLPVRARDVSRSSMRGLIEQMQRELTGALRHQRYRFEDIRTDAGLADTNTASFGPIVNLMFFDQPIEIEGAEVDYRILSSGILEDLRLNIYQASPGAPVVIDLHGNPNVYGSAELQQHVDRFSAFLFRALDDLDALILDVDFLMPGEREEILQWGIGPCLDVDRGGHLLDAYLAQLDARPDTTAVVFGDRRLTLHEFDAVRRRFAGLLHTRGVGVGDNVVVVLDRSVEQVAALYAIVTLGAAYVPVDPQQPDHRRRTIIESVEAAAVVDEAFLSDIASTSVASWSGGVHGGGDHGAYVIFTSGSTGVPKGVKVSHRAIINRLDWMQDEYGIDADDTILYKTPYTFDVSVWELFWPLRQGATMVIAPPGAHRDPDQISRLIADTGVTTLHFVPSMLDVYTEVVAAEKHRKLFASSVRRVFASGEALPATLASRVLAESSAELINLYGPTEAAVDVTAHRVTASEDVVPIGRAVANTDVYVLDKWLQPVPVGVPGELYLAGCQLADGYVGRTALTSERFVANPLQGTGTRMYRTGDLVRWSADHEIEYLGRSDFQIKIRGQRVELGEIEAVLCEAPGIDTAAVVARTDLGSAPVLVAYVRTADTVTDEAEALAWCRRHLPSHMVPHAVVTMTEFPTNASGKLDRASLPVPGVRAETAYVAPRTRIERLLAELTADVLGVDRVGMRDNLFVLGADSLTAARLVSRARTELDIHFNLATLFSVDNIGDLAAAARVSDGGRPRLQPVTERPAIIPVSPLQVRLWFLNRMNPSSGVYNISGAVRLPGGVDRAALNAAVAEVVARHEPLRTRFPMVGGEPVQDVVAVEDAKPTVHDIDVDGTDGRTALLAEAARGFDLLTEMPLRVSLLDEPGGAVVLVVLHHIVGDGFSLPPLINDVFSAYTRHLAGDTTARPAPAVSYVDYTLWSHEALGSLDHPSADAKSSLDFWRAELAGMPDMLALPTDRPRPPVASGAGAYYDFPIDAELSSAVREFARSRSVTPFTVLHGALAIVLSRWSGQNDVAIGTATAGRDEPELAELIGMFVNTVVLRTSVASEDSIADLLAKAHAVRTRALAHADIPFDRVVDALTPARAASRSPLFQVAFTMYPGQNAALHELVPGAELVDARVPAAKFDLAITVTDDDQPDSGGHSVGYDVEFSYATDLFDQSTIADLSEQFRSVVGTLVAADPGMRVGAVDLVQRRPVVSDEVTPKPAAFAHVLAGGLAQAQLDAIAVHGDRDVTWASMEAESNQLARELCSRGIGRGDVVAIAIPRSVHSVLATVAVAKAGAAFVSIDPAHPVARRAEIVDDSGATLGISVRDVSSTLPPTLDWLTLDDENTELQLAGHSGAPLRSEELSDVPRLDDLAYLIYTSGSTGKPKAAAVSHRGLANLVGNQRRILGLDKASRVLHVASPSFDASIFEILMALGAGGALVVSPPGVFGGAELENLIATQRITHAVMTPSALATLDPTRVPDLSHVISVGEACPPELSRRWVRAGHAFYNLYGPTEVTIWATAAGPLSESDEVPIGSEVPGVVAHVLDHALRPAAPGVPGELYLSGVQLARGYHRRPDLTCGRFVADPFGSGGRMYRTGDRVVRDRDGILRYLGRVDFQLKLRGLRIEPGEIDGALHEHRAVDHAVSVGVRGPAGDDVLVSYVVLLPGARATPGDLLLHVSGRLPEYLVPRKIVIVDNFVLTAAGKVDRQALPPVDFDDETPHVAPRTQIETLISDVFCDVLGTSRVSVVSDFFDLGGNSLSATKVAARVGTVLDRTIPVRMIFEHPSVAELARQLSTGNSSGSVTPLRPRSRAEMVPVSEMQRGLWLINQADPASAAYNVALALRLDGELDVVALDLALKDLVARHEALRTVYPMVNGEPIQVIMPADGDWTETLSLRSEPAGSGGAIAEITGKGFDVTAELPVRAALLDVAENSSVLVVVVHHISADGGSMSALARDLMAAYGSRRLGAEPSWQPLPIQYADYSLWQADRLSTVTNGQSECERQLDYWQRRLDGIGDRLDLPTDRVRPRNPTFAGDAVNFTIPAELATELERIAHEHRSTLFMVTQAAFAVLLSRLSGQADIVIGTPFAGRGEQGLDEVVGMFVNTLALRTTVDSSESFTDLLGRVRRDDLVDMSNTDVAFDTIVSRVLKGAPTSHNPIYQVMFAFQNLDFPRLDLGDLTVTPVSEELSAAKVDLQLSLFPQDPGGSATEDLRAQLLFATDLFDRSTIERFAQRYVTLLRSVVDGSDHAVGDLSILSSDEVRADVDTASEEPSPPLPDAIARAAIAAPAGTAVDFGSGSVSFADLDLMAQAMQATTPDRDSALTVALMTLVPDLAAAGPEQFDAVLTELAQHAAAAIAGVGSAGDPATDDTTADGDIGVESMDPRGCP
ncbi:non-ribosomal peptide synthetase [Gordonia otitidis]|uniref:Non-ribosomal peptide synthetase n=1 Tax=Gordonia otitidis (strain DSM 44809 / CCUG 52243 / JCM 12355 / NBRC 100426 / IFM 10032) TaxID=1108044 RepID=H5TG23_GORO1|nr:non-ribosomal peptide synthetase [Gordonia otitidis]GAB32431.1 putative non-ribosomal peptide synthetase [Gordonia otitidis NBRC 100426]